MYETLYMILTLGKTNSLPTFQHIVAPKNKKKFFSKEKQKVFSTFE